MKSISNRLALIVCTLIFFSLCSCSTKREHPKMNLSADRLIPKPSAITPTGTSFILDQWTSFETTTPSLDKLKTQIKKDFSDYTAIDFAAPDNNFSHKKSKIIFSLGSDETTPNHEEGYSITIEKDKINVQAQSAAGIFYAAQTLKQLIPIDSINEAKENQTLYIASGNITDQPIYTYRGIMIDVARHFFDIKEIKKQIDQMAFYKMNHLHLHLSDDQGWRIEIKSWPKLTTIGGSSSVGGTKPGFFTQEDYKELVSYASDRFITIVPEIDMPSHINAALASYAGLNPDKKVKPLYEGTEVGFSTLTNELDSTYLFVNDVIQEICEMTPGPYFHIGGDEAMATKMEDYIPFIDSAQAIIEQQGKTMIGWDEVAHSNLKPNQIVQFWRKVENTKMGISKKAKVIMSPADKAYLDMKYDESTKLGLKWAAYIPVDSAYNWEASTFSPEINKTDILGIEAPLWTETIVTSADLEYLMYPRLLGYSELAWSGNQTWEDYKLRLAYHGLHLKRAKINFHQSSKVPWK